MKKSLFLASLSLFLMFAGTVNAQTSDRSVNLTLGKSEAQINGNSVILSAPAQVVGGSTMVPLRFISEAFGCDVQWNGKLNTATVTLVDQVIEVPVGQKQAIINGLEVEVQVPAQSINGSTYVPLRFISENLGAKVDYNTNTRAIAITVKTYFSKEKGFEVIIPEGWVVEEETAEGIAIAANDYCKGEVGFSDKGEGIDTSNFNGFAEEFFKGFESYDVLYTDVNIRVALIMYNEDGYINVCAAKLLDNGIYVCVIAAPEETLDDNLLSQYIIMVNTLASPVSR